MSSLPAAMYVKVQELKGRQETKPGFFAEINLIVTGICAAWQPKSEHDLGESTDSYMRY